MKSVDLPLVDLSCNSKKIVLIRAKQEFCERKERAALTRKGKTMGLREEKCNSDFIITFLTRIFAGNEEVGFEGKNDKHKSNGCEDGRCHRYH